MSFRNTALLAVAVALLGAYLYWVERPAVQEEAETKPLLDFDPLTVDRLVLTTRDGPVDVHRAGEDWRIVNPLDTRAEGRTITTLIETAAEAEDKRTLADPASDLAPFGLDAPDAILELFSGETQVARLSIGRGTPIGFQAYVQRGDDPAVHLTGGTVRAALLKNLTDLREKTVLRFDEGAVDAIVIERGGETPTRLERTPEGWLLVAPEEAPVAEPEVRNLLSALRALRAVEFLPDQQAQSPANGLDPPSLLLTIEAGGTATRLHLGNEIDRGDKSLVAAAVEGRDEVYLVGTHVPASLGKSADDLRDKRIVGAAADSVASIRIRIGTDEGFDLVRTADGWDLPAQPDTDPLLAQRLADDILGLTGDRVVRDPGEREAALHAEPSGRIELFDAENATLRTIVPRAVGEDPPRGYAEVLDEEILYGLAPTTLARILKRAPELVRADSASEGPDDFVERPQ